jgi:hypothetical protein
MNTGRAQLSQCGLKCRSKCSRHQSATVQAYQRRPRLNQLTQLPQRTPFDLQQELRTAAYPCQMEQQMTAQQEHPLLGTAGNFRLSKGVRTVFDSPFHTAMERGWWGKQSSPVRVPPSLCPAATASSMLLTTVRKVTCGARAIDTRIGWVAISVRSTSQRLTTIRHTSCAKLIIAAGWHSKVKPWQGTEGDTRHY